jgi:hypothetical protein
VQVHAQPQRLASVVRLNAALAALHCCSCRYGGKHIISASDYFAADLTPPSAAGDEEQQQGQQHQQRVRRALRGEHRAARGKSSSKLLSARQQPAV